MREIVVRLGSMFLEKTYNLTSEQLEQLGEIIRRLFSTVSVKSGVARVIEPEITGEAS